MPKFLISSQDLQFSNIIYKINELDLLWVPNFISLEVTFIFWTKFSWNEEIDTFLMLNVCYLVVAFIFLAVTLWLLLVT